MPLYDFECPHKHQFDRQCLIADRLKPVPCEGKVNRMIIDDEILASLEDKDELPEDHEWVDLEVGVDLAKGEKVSTAIDAKQRVLIKKVPCILSATMVMRRHNNPGGALNHNSAANRDAAREGRYDPLNPSRRFISKGRKWRK